MVFICEVQKIILTLLQNYVILLIKQNKVTLL